MNFIARKISETRKIKGLTQEELAEQSKVNLRTIQRIENSENEPREKTLSLICEVLNIDLEEFINPDVTLEDKSLATQLINGLFLIILNLILVAIIGFLTLDVNANVNSVFGGVLLSVFIPFFIVSFTKKMTGAERLLKFGFGYLSYFILVLVLHGFPVGFSTGLFPCLLISVLVLYFSDKKMITTF